MSYIYDLADTWNDGATTFTAVKMNVTDTASAAASLLMDLQVGASSRFNVGKTGSLKLGVSPTGTNQAGTNVTISGSQGTGTGAGGSIIFQVAPAGSSGASQNPLADALTITSGRSFQFRGAAASNLSFAGEAIYAMNTAATQNKAMLSEYGIRAAADVPIGFSNSTSSVGTQDVFLYRDGSANTLALRNGTNAQTARVYGTYTGVSDYRRLGLSMSTAGVAEIKPEGAGTGASGNVLHISGLPTSNPGPGILWNNAGTPAIGT